MSTRPRRNLSALTSVTLAMAVAMLLSPIASRADTPGMKAGRGFAAITTPFLEIPGNIVETSEREGPLAGWTEGLARGIGMSIVRPPVGAFELVTALIAAPADYKPIIEPEYPWSYFGPREIDVAAPPADACRRSKR